VVIDTNIVFSALLKEDSRFTEIILSSQYEFYGLNFCWSSCSSTKNEFFEAQHRAEKPYGLDVGHPDAPGTQRVVRAKGEVVELRGIDGCEVGPGDQLGRRPLPFFDGVVLIWFIRL
jgi:hypothetical protein